MVYTATFSGLDGAGKSTSGSSISRILADEGYRVVYVRRESFVDLPNQQRRYIATRINRLFDVMHTAADQRHHRTLVGLINLAYCFAQRGIESHAIRTYQPDVLLVGRDPHIDPFAYSGYYFPFLQNVTPEKRMKLILSMNPNFPDVTIYMEVDPVTAYARILSRIDREKREKPSSRKKWPHMHENPHDLNFIRDQFETSIDILAFNPSSRIVRVKVERPQEEVIEEMLGHIKRTKK